jgi:hypothetical protein
MRYTRNYIPHKEWGGALSGASSGYQMGAAIGTMFGPVGTGVGAAIGAVGGAMFGHFGEEKRTRQQKNLMLANNALIAKEKYKTDILFKRQTKANDAAYLSNFRLNNSSSMYMQKGGKVSNYALGLVNKGAKEFRDNTASFDSLRTILRPEFIKAQKAGKDHLTSSDIKKILGDDGHKMYNRIGDYLSEAYNINKELGINMSDFKGVNENTTDKIAGYLYGKKIDEHKFPNPKFTITHTDEGKPTVVDTTIYAYPNNLKKPAYIKKNGGRIAASGKSLGNGNKLLTKNGTTSGLHELGDNIPIVKNGKTVAIAEPGEVLTEDSNGNDFILSKRLGFAQKFMQLEAGRTSKNSKMIDKEQNKLVVMNNRLVSKNTPMAYDGLSLFNLGTNARKSFNSVGTMQTSHIGPKAPSMGIQKYKGATGIKPIASTSFLDKLKGLDTNTIVGAAGTIGNILMSNATLNRQKKYVQDSLNTALSFEPKLNKNYLLNENIDVNAQVGAVNQGYASTTSKLDLIDPAIASALKNTAGITRTNQLNSIYGQRNNMMTGIRNQNTMNIMNNTANNNALINQSQLSKINAKIAANEQFGELEGTRLGNMQGAISEFNTILRDRDMMNTLKARWKDSVGNDPFGFKYGGKIRKRKSYMYN